MRFVGRLGHDVVLGHAEQARSAVWRREEAAGWPLFEIRALSESGRWVDCW